MSTNLPPTDQSPTDPHLEREIHAQLISLLFQQQVSGAVANLLVSTFFVALVWGEVTGWKLLTWYGCHLGAVALRLYSRNRFMTRVATPGDEVWWGRFSLIFSALVGSSWGICALLFLSLENPQAYIALSIIITGFAAGSVPAFAPYFPGFLAHVVPSMGGLALALVLTGDRLAMGIAAFVAFGFMAYTPASRNVNRMLRQSVRLGFENLALRNRAEERTQLLHTVLETMSQGILVEDRDHQPLIWNDRLARMVAPTGGDSADDSAMLMRSLEVVDIPGSAARFRPFERQLDNGRVLEILSTEMPSGGAVTTFSDITPLIERERAEEAARIAAEQANAAKTRFLAAASHDLRQPIHALGLFVDALSESHSPDQTRKLMGHVRDSLQIIDNMLGSLLDISKLDAGVVHPEPEPFDAGDLVDGIYQSALQEAQNAGLKIRFRCSGLTAVCTDRGMLGRIVRNLVNNALRYTENGGVLVAVRSRVAGIRIDVIDTGIGIPDEKRDEIFVEFHQLGNLQRDRQQGLGLGLAIVSRLVSLLGLKISTRSRLGRGSCFSLFLPPCHSDLVSQAEHGVWAPVQGELDSVRILVLDDDPDVLLAMGVLLRQWGCDVRDAGLFEDALVTVFGDWVPQLLIIDYRLPGIRDGIEAIDRMRAHIGPVPAVIITGDTGPEHLRRAEESGLPVLHKPVRSDRLRELLVGLLSPEGGQED